MKKGMLILFILLFGCSTANEEPAGMVDSEGFVNDDDDDSLLSPNRFLTIAHRGASAYAPEHTLIAYELGEEMEADYIEIDLQMTKDGELIALHDADLSRTTNEEASVYEMVLEDIKVLDAGTWFNEENPDLAQPVFNHASIPTLDEIIDTFGHDSNYYIETKTPEEYPGMVDALLDTLDRHGLLDEDVPKGKVIIQSFSADSLLEVHEKDPTIPLIQLIHYAGRAAISSTELDQIRSYAVGIGVNHGSLTKRYVEKVRQAELLLHPYTVNEEEDMKRLIEWGVNGIFTDYPDVLRRVLSGT